MKFRCEAADRLQYEQENEGSRAWLGEGLGSRRGDLVEGERGTQGKTERKRGRGPRKPEREEIDETKPNKAFYFSSLKNKKQTHCFN